MKNKKTLTLSFIYKPKKKEEKNVLRIASVVTTNLEDQNIQHLTLVYMQLKSTGYNIKTYAPIWLLIVNTIF